jgi:hypothetical protein
MPNKRLIAALASLILLTSFALADEAAAPSPDIRKVVVGSGNYAYYSGDATSEVFFNGETLGTFSGIVNPSFQLSEKGNLFFIRKTEEGFSLVYKGREFGPYESIFWRPRGLIDLGDRIVYIANKRGGRSMIYSDETEIGEAAIANAYSRIVADEAGKTIAYPYADADYKWFLKANEKILGGPYDSLSFISMLDGGSVVYAYQKGKKWYFVGDKGELGPFDSISFPAASKDGKHYAFVGKNGDLQSYYYDGKLDRSTSLKAGGSFGPIYFVTTPGGTVPAQFIGVNDKRYLFLGNVITGPAPRTTTWPREVAYNAKSSMFYFLDDGYVGDKRMPTAVYRTFLSAKDSYQIVKLPGDTGKKAYPVLPLVKLCELPDNKEGFALCHSSDGYAIALKESGPKLKIKHGAGELTLDGSSGLGDMKLSPNDEWLSFEQNGRTFVTKGGELHIGAFSESKAVYVKDGAIVVEDLVER